MQSALLVVTLSLSTVGCHHRSACVSGVRHGCYGGCYSQARYGGCYGGCYGGGYSGGWVQPASYAPGVYRGGSYGVAPSGQAMGYAPTSGFSTGTYGMAGTGTSWPTSGYSTGSVANYGTPVVNTYGANYGYSPGGAYPNYGAAWPNAYNSWPNTYSRGFGMPGSSPYFTGYGNYPGYASPYGGMYGPGTYSSAYGPAPLTQQVINAGRATGLLPSQAVNNAVGTAGAAPRAVAPAIPAAPRAR